MACTTRDRLNGRLLLGLKGTISELELHLLRGRLTAGLLSKAARGELALQLPAGLVRDADGRVTKDPDREVQDRLALIFTTFLEQGSVAKVMRSLSSRRLAVPRRDRFGEVAWRAPTTGMLGDILKNPAYAGAFVYGRTRSCHRHYRQRQAGHHPLPDGGVEDRGAGQVSRLHRLGAASSGSRRCCATTTPSTSGTRRAGCRATARPCSRASSGAGSAATRWRCSTRPATATSATTCSATQGEPVCQHLPADPIDAGWWPRSSRR